MRFLPAAAMLLVVPGSAWAGEVKVDRIDIVDAGIYKVEIGEPVADPDAPTGSVAPPVTATNIEKTDTIRGTVGVEFGFRYVIVGDPAGDEVPLEYVFGFPEPGLVDPADPEPMRESRILRDKKIGETIYIGYGFENAWEIVPGTWTMEIRYDGRSLARQDFTVTK